MDMYMQMFDSCSFIQMQLSVRERWPDSMLHDLVRAEVFVRNRVPCVTKTTSATLWRLNYSSVKPLALWCLEGEKGELLQVWKTLSRSWGVRRRGQTLLERPVSVWRETNSKLANLPDCCVSFLSQWCLCWLFQAEKTWQDQEALTPPAWPSASRSVSCLTL